MVATLFVCIDITYSSRNGSPKNSNGSIAGTKEAGTHVKATSRHAA